MQTGGSHLQTGAVCKRGVTRLENDEAQQLDGRGVNAPTIIEFFDAYTPLMVNSSNYILDIARFQIELVIHPSFVNVRMENYNSSIIAFAE